MKQPYTESPLWHEKIGRIYQQIERVKNNEDRLKEQHGDVLHLRRLNRIMAVHSSTAIEGNKLTLSEVTDVINNLPVWGSPKDIKEVKNAWDAYNILNELDPWSVDDFLDAHELLTRDLIAESGKFRSVDVAVIRDDGVVMHRGADPADVPKLVAELLDWGRESIAHPLILSSVIHFMIEQIHPFRDGNGRIGRLWQTLVLSKWNPIFEWMPIETLVHNNQEAYYNALQASRTPELDCRPFIDCMLDMIEGSISRYSISIGETNIKAQDGGTNGGINGGINDRILKCFSENPSYTIKEMSEKLGISKRVAERHVAGFKAEGKLQRVGSNKNGKCLVVLTNSQLYANM